MSVASHRSARGLCWQAVGATGVTGPHGNVHQQADLVCGKGPAQSPFGVSVLAVPFAWDTFLAQRSPLQRHRNSHTKAPHSVHRSLSPHPLSPITPSLEFFPSLICLFIISWNLSTSRRQELVSLCHRGDLGPQTASTLYPAGAWETGGERRKKFHSSETQPPSPRHSFLLATGMPWTCTLCSSLHSSEQTQDPALGELTS